MAVDILTNIHGRECGLDAEGGLVLNHDDGTQTLVPKGGGHVSSDGSIILPEGGVLGLSEATPYVTLTSTGTAFSGACELAGWYCSVAAGSITIYDNTSATGTPIVPATALVVGPMPIFGPGTNHRLMLTAGCHVVLSGAATVRVAVGA